MVLIDYAYSQEICILSMLLVEDVLTTYSVSAKIQAFNLLSHLPELNQPLIPQLRSAASKCLVHVPNNSTRRVPPITCPGLRVGVQAQHHHHRLYRDSCHHLIYNKHPARPFLLQQLSKYTRHLSTDVFISTSKIFYALNQILVDQQRNCHRLTINMTLSTSTTRSSPPMRTTLSVPGQSTETPPWKVLCSVAA